MKASELRIGNYIKLMYNYEDYETIQVTSDELVDVDKKRADYEPMPLTEEWLYKFGFKDIDKGEHDYITYTDPNHDYYLQIDVRKKDGKYSILDNSFNDLRDFSMVDISYVHQLQNLYFALTGEELIYYLNMNKEQEQIIDEAYENYINSLFYDFSGEVKGYLLHEHLSKEEFINKCKTDNEFSEKWGLKIEERELSDEERDDLKLKLILEYLNKKGIITVSFEDFKKDEDKIPNIDWRREVWGLIGWIGSGREGDRDKLKEVYADIKNIPTKLITLTYNNERIESYE